MPGATFFFLGFRGARPQLLAQAPDVRAALLRLKCSNLEAETTAHLVKHRALPAPAATDAEVRRWLAQAGPEHVESILAVNQALGAPAQPRIREILASNPPLTTKALALDGKALMGVLNVGPSKAIGDATRHLLQVVLDDPSRNTVDSLTAEIRAWFKA